MKKTASLFAVVISMILGASCFASLPPVTDGLIGCWNFDEGSGKTAIDSSGNGNNGTIVNATYTNDDPAILLTPTFSLRFNNTAGSAYDYVTIPTNPTLEPSSGLTLAAWVKTSSTADRIRVIISKPYGGSGDDSYVLWYDGSLLQFSLQGIGRISTAQPTANEWHQIVAIYNGSVMQIYVDSIEEASATFSGALVYTDNPVLIGADINLGTKPDEGWSGLIDDVLIYNRSLTQTEISQIIPELTSVLFLPLLMSATMIGVIIYAWRRNKQTIPSFS